MWFFFLSFFLICGYWLRTGCFQDDLHIGRERGNFIKYKVNVICSLMDRAHTIKCGEVR